VPSAEVIDWFPLMSPHGFCQRHYAAEWFFLRRMMV
jgi:hypothetical protein